MTALDTAYQAQRQRLTHAVTVRAAALFGLGSVQQETVAQIVPVVEAGQKHIVALLDAYMAAKMTSAVGHGAVKGLDPSLYTTSLLRGVDAESVYGRPFAVLHAAAAKGSRREDAHASAQAALEKLARTDLQLAHTHSAHDWMNAEPTIVGYRRVLTGPGPHCELCTLASHRTYHKADLMPIHEACSCTVEALWGTEPVASAGTTVRVDNDPELGPRLMAEKWSPVGPRIHVTH